MAGPAQGLTTAEAKARLGRDGPNEVTPPPDRPWRRFAARFSGLSAWMLEAIVVLSFLLGRRADMALALTLLVANAIVGFLQEQRAAAALGTLRRQLQVLARVLRDGAWGTLPARELAVGDVIRLRAGDFVPADVRLLDGELAVDRSALTGESAASEDGAGADVPAGAVVRRGEATAEVTATGGRTRFGRVAELVATSHPRLRVEATIARVVRWLAAIVGAMVAVTLLVAAARGLPLLSVLPLALVVMMSAVPVALPVMFTVSMALGAMELARCGVLVTRLNAAEDAAGMDVLCADKTGTLTQNRLALAGVMAEPGIAEDEVVRTGALASDEADQDPIDLAFLAAAGDGERPRLLRFTPFSARTRRTEAEFEGPAGRVRAMKGALATVAAAAGVDDAARTRLEAEAAKAAARGWRVLAVARAEGDGPWQLLGLACLADPPRPDSGRLIAELRGLGVAVKLLTGDALPVARETARLLGLGAMATLPREADGGALLTGTDGFAEVFPEDKHRVVAALQKAGHVVAMTGDGVNDAPALRQAEVGIAVAAARDVAKGAASVVLTTEGLGGIVDLVRTGRAIYQRVLTWIVNKICQTILKAGLAVVPFLATGRFAVSALGMVLLVFVSDFVVIALATDRVRPSPRPETWRIGPLLGMAVAVGLLMLGESLGLLALAWRPFGLGVDLGRLHGFAFLLLLGFALAAVPSLRERRAFWASRPSRTLALSLLGAAAAGVAVGLLGFPGLAPLPPAAVALALGGALAAALGPNDLLKRLMLARLERVQALVAQGSGTRGQ